MWPTICRPQQCIRSLTGSDSSPAFPPTAAVTAASAAASSALQSMPSRAAAAAVGMGWPLFAQGKPLGVRLTMFVNLFCGDKTSFLV
jgi:hypothetical protein